MTSSRVGRPRSAAKGRRGAKARAAAGEPTAAKPQSGGATRPGASSHGREHAGRPADSRERILEAASALMAERGFAATSISALSERCGLPASSIYWHFGSKEGLLAAVMESGNERWLNSLPRADELSPEPRQRVAELFDAIARGLEAQPEFLRLMMLLALERRDVDPALLEGIRRVRRRALDSARPMIEALLAPVARPEAARRIADELSLFTLVFADGSFLAYQIDPQVDLRRLFDHLRVGLLALAERLVGEPS